MSANKPYIIGVTGGIGCGKTEAAAFLESLGAARVDADAISRSLTAPGGEALPAIIGSQFFQADQVFASCIPGFADTGNAVLRIDWDFRVRIRSTGIIHDDGIVFFVDQLSVLIACDGIQYFDLSHTHIYLMYLAGYVDLFR